MKVKNCIEILHTREGRKREKRKKTTKSFTPYGLIIDRRKER